MLVLNVSYKAPLSTMSFQAANNASTIATTTLSNRINLTSSLSSNQCQPDGELEDDQLYVNLSTFWYCFLAFITTVGLLVSLISNMIIIYLFTSTSSLRRIPSNIIAVNLSLSDLLYSIQWPSIIYCSLTQSTWMLEIDFVCKTFGFITVTTASASILTVLAMSVERAVVIKYSIYAKSRYTIRGAWLIVLLIWVASICSSLPPLFNKYNRFTLDPSKTSCTPKTNYKLYILMIYITYWILPTIIISICYIFIIVTFKRSSRTLSQLGAKKQINPSFQTNMTARSWRSCDTMSSQQPQLPTSPLASSDLFDFGQQARQSDSEHSSKIERRSCLRDSIKLDKFRGYLRHKRAGARLTRQACLDDRDSEQLSEEKFVPEMFADQKRRSSAATEQSGTVPTEIQKASLKRVASAQYRKVARPVIRDHYSLSPSLQGSSCEIKLERVAMVNMKRSRMRLSNENSFSNECKRDCCSFNEGLHSDSKLQELTTELKVPTDDKLSRTCNSSMKSKPTLRKSSNQGDSGHLNSTDSHRSERRISFDADMLKASEQINKGAITNSTGQISTLPFELSNLRRNETRQNNLSGRRFRRESTTTLSSEISIRHIIQRARDNVSHSSWVMSQFLHRDNNENENDAQIQKGSDTSCKPGNSSTAASITGCHFGGSNSQLSRKSIQIRLAKMSFYLILLWLVSWTPIASLAMINLVVKCHHRASALAVFLANTMTKLGPAFDVFIYGVSHPKIKRKFTLIIKRLLLLSDDATDRNPNIAVDIKVYPLDRVSVRSNTIVGPRKERKPF